MSSTREIRKLNRLLELDYDAIEAYEAAIDGLVDPLNRQAMQRYCEDHRQHTQLLTKLIVSLGGEPSRGPDWMQVLTKGKVQLAKMVGGDRAILFAMRINEEVTNRRYELAIATDGISAASLKVLRANLGDERRHREWLSLRLSGAEVAVPESKPRRRTTRKPAARKTTNKRGAASAAA